MEWIKEWEHFDEILSTRIHSPIRQEIKEFITTQITKAREELIADMKYGIEHVEIKGQRRHAHDKSPEQAAIIQEMYDNHIKPVLLKTLRALKDPQV